MKKALLLFLIIEIFFLQNMLCQTLNADSLTLNKLNTISQFLHLSATDKIADIGTGSGYSLVPIANQDPNIFFTVEDIDSSRLNKKNLLKRIKTSEGKASIDKFNIVYGTEISTNLPSATFNKVLLFDVVHEFSDRNIMLQDVKRILTNNGSVFIEEILVHHSIKKDRGCNFPFLTEDAFKQLMADNKFKLVKEQITFDTGKNRYMKIFEYIATSSLVRKVTN
ncbi:MAG: class I SAM-dependent methyltransferase [Ferruginibacter sp.]|nr:class I SAM-dependent methyltransferase [Ferruginibacter sp.]